MLFSNPAVAPNTSCSTAPNKNELDSISKKNALDFAQKEIGLLIKRGNLKEPKQKSDRELGINTVSGGRYIRAFTKLPNLDLYEKSVLLNLASRLDFRGLDDNGFFQDEIRFVTQEQLADDLSISERKVRDVFTSLIQKKFIEKKNHYNFEKKCRSVNSYSITEHAFIECFNTLKRLNDEKYNEYLEELERAKQYYVNMFLSSPRIQTIHTLPAQHAGSFFSYNPPTGTACRYYRHSMPEHPAQRADIFLLILPLKISPFLICVDKINFFINSHTKSNQIQKNESEQRFEKNSNENTIQKHPNKMSWKPKPKNEQNIPLSMCRKLSDILCEILNRDFVDNDDCLDIIKSVTTDAHKTVKEFRTMMVDLAQYDSHLIFNPDLILKQKKMRRDLNAKEVALNLSKWITSKDEILTEAENLKKLQEEIKNQKEMEFLEHLKNEQQIKKEQELKNKEEMNALKEFENKEFEKLPLKFKQWFHELPPFNKKELKKSIRKYGAEKFSNEIIPTITSYISIG